MAQQHERRSPSDGAQGSLRAPAESSARSVDGRRKGKRARAGSPAARRRVVTFKVSDDELRGIDELAQALGTDRSGAIRFAVLDSHQSAKLEDRYRDEHRRPSADLSDASRTALTRAADALSDVELQVRKVGVNVNQIACAANRGAAVDSRSLTQCAEAIEAATSELNRLDVGIDRAWVR